MFGGYSSWSLSSDSQQSSDHSLSSNIPPSERRPLRSVPTVGPHHRVDPEVLAKEFVEKELKVVSFLVAGVQLYNLNFLSVIPSVCPSRVFFGICRG